MPARLVRWVGIGGLLFVVLIVASVFVLPGPPNSHATAAKVVSYYHDHKSAAKAEAYIIGVAVVLGVFFFWYLRDLISVADDDRRLATIGFAGGVMFGVSGALASGLYWAAADGIGHVDPTVVQAMNLFQSDGILFVIGAGIAVFLIGTGLAVVRSRVLPAWLGWLGVVLGVVTLALPFSGPSPAGVWVLIASIVILVRPPSLSPATS